jgi:hypothetical protein
MCRDGKKEIKLIGDNISVHLSAYLHLRKSWAQPQCYGGPSSHESFGKSGYGDIFAVSETEALTKGYDVPVSYRKDDEEYYDFDQEAT